MKFIDELIIGALIGALIGWVIVAICSLIWVLS